MLGGGEGNWGARTCSLEVQSTPSYGRRDPVPIGGWQPLQFTSDKAILMLRNKEIHRRNIAGCQAFSVSTEHILLTFIYASVK